MMLEMQLSVLELMWEQLQEQAQEMVLKLMDIIQDITSRQSSTSWVFWVHLGIGSIELIRR